MKNRYDHVVNYRPTIPLQSKQILVVERSELRKTIARLLQMEGYVVHEAQDGFAALKALEWETPDLILANVQAEDPSSEQFFNEVRKNRVWVTIPFVFLSPKSHTANERTTRDVGGDDSITIPFNPQHLIRTVTTRLLRSAEVRVAHMNQAYIETVTMLAKVVEGRDPYTHGHIDRVVSYARRLAYALGWPEDRMPTLELGARLHDLGKIAVRDEVLNKKGPLTVQEWEEMRQHPTTGARMLEPSTYLSGAIPYVLYHHERWDGSGYPHGLAGRAIPIEGRLMAVVDVYDALTTSRPYHPARPSREVIEYMQLRSGSLFDPELVDAFIEVLRQNR